MTESPARATPPRPPSDVSVWVGLVGLAGLLVWVAICRAWPQIAEALALPGPRERMAGSSAAVFALVFSGVPMVAWSLLVDKVHRRASTGIDWSAPRLPDGASGDLDAPLPCGLEFTL